MYAEIRLRLKDFPCGSLTCTAVRPELFSHKTRERLTLTGSPLTSIEPVIVDNLPVARGANASGYFKLDAARGRKGAGK
jgi:hypothetical protein